MNQVETEAVQPGSAEEAAAGDVRIVYIFGYGRSGSTILDLALGSFPSSSSVGEVCHLYDWLESERPCACGKPLRECEFWRGVVDAHLAAGSGSTKLLRSVESLTALPSLLLGDPQSPKFRDYKRCLESLYDALARERGVRRIIDSSKSTRLTAGRFLALQKLTKYEVKGVFLTRDGRGVMWSEMKRGGSPEQGRWTESKLLNAIRCALSWAMTNALSLLLRRLAAKGSVKTVRYEELCRDPAASIADLAGFLDNPVEKATLEQGIPIEGGHTVAGNRLRFAKRLELRPDTEWISRLPRFYEGLFWLLTFPVALSLGYTPGRRRP